MFIRQSIKFNFSPSSSLIFCIYLFLFHHLNSLIFFLPHFLNTSSPEKPNLVPLTSSNSNSNSIIRGSFTLNTFIRSPFLSTLDNPTKISAIVSSNWLLLRSRTCSLGQLSLIASTALRRSDYSRCMSPN